MSIYKRGKTWWVDFRFSGVRIRRSAFTTDQHQAEIYEKSLLAECYSNYLALTNHTVHDSRLAGRRVAEALLETRGARMSSAFPSGRLKGSSKSRDGFPESLDWVPELRTKQWHQSITCSGCGHTEKKQVTGQGAAPQTLIKHFSRLGWKLGSTRKKDKCPTCAGTVIPPDALAVIKDPKPVDYTPEIPQPVEVPAFSLDNFVLPTSPIEVAPPPEAIPEQPMQTVSSSRATPSPSKPIAADPPRKPTREQRRLILGALDDSYDPVRKCYLAGHTDKSVAGKMNIPWAWVAEIRDEFFGPEGNEDTYRVMEELEAVKKSHEATAIEINKTLALIKTEMDNLLRYKSEVLVKIEETLRNLTRYKDEATSKLRGHEAALKSLEDNFDRISKRL